MNTKILVFSVIGMIILFLVIIMILVFYNRHVINEIKNNVNDATYEQDKINTNSELIQIMNKSIVDYINSLNIADGETLNKIQGETTTALKNVQDELNKKDELIRDLTKQVNDNKSNVAENK